MSKRSANARRHHRLRAELDDLERRNANAPPGGRTPYQRRLGQVILSWSEEMGRRAKSLDPALRVWALVDSVREGMGDRYGDMAAEIAVSLLERVQRQGKPLSARNGQS